MDPRMKSVGSYDAYFKLAVVLLSDVLTVVTITAITSYLCTIALYVAIRQWSLYVPPVVTVCTASGHCMYHQLNIQQFYVLPTQCIYVLYGSENSDYFPIQH
jgi:hypothetical protein